MDEKASGVVRRFVTEAVLAAARDTSAVMLDGGTDAGVMAIAGRARRELEWDGLLVGVAPAGKVRAGEIAAGQGTTRLEPHHSHQMLVPGSEWGDELPWLIDIARSIAGKSPVVAVVINGGPHAMEEARACAEQGWSVVPLAGSGRTADELAEANQVVPDGPDTSTIRPYQASAGPEGLRARLRELLAGEGTEAPRRVARTATSSSSADRSPTNDEAASAFTLAMRQVDYPALYVAASNTSRRGQATFKRLTRAELVCVIGGAAIGVSAAWLETVPSLGVAVPTEAAALASAASFLLALGLKLANRIGNYDADWFDGRAVAETVKSHVWRYMMRTGPYDGSHGDTVFAHNLAAVLRARPGLRQALDRVPDQPQQVTPRMKSVRASRAAQRRDLYINQRLIDQATWYQARSVAATRSARRLFWGAFAFEGGAFGVALLSLAPFGQPLLGVLGLFAAVAAAMTAWTQLNRYDEVARSYAVACQELLLSATIGRETSTSLEALVTEGETAISREHQMWIAKRGEPLELESVFGVPRDRRHEC